MFKLICGVWRLILATITAANERRHHQAFLRHDKACHLMERQSAALEEALRIRVIDRRRYARLLRRADRYQRMLDNMEVKA